MSIVDCDSTHMGIVDKVEGGHLKILRHDPSCIFRKSSLELRDQARQGFGLLMRGEVTAGQPLDL
jgi:hypothetical protein